MNKTTIKAIIDSIAKWDLIAHGVKVDRGGCNCPLCKLFIHNCDDCPVCIKTYDIQCRSSPYVDIHLPRNMTIPEWAYYTESKRYKIVGFGSKVDETLWYIEKEIEFLISLLPDEELKNYEL